MEEAQLKLGELRNNMRAAASELMRKWCLSIKERDNLLGKVKIWHHTV